MGRLDEASAERVEAREDHAIDDCQNEHRVSDDDRGDSARDPGFPEIDEKREPGNDRGKQERKKDDVFEESRRTG